MGRIVDLDARRAARAEAQGEPPEVVLGGERFTLPVRLPLEALDLMADGQFRAAFRLLLADEDAVSRFFAHRPDDADLEDLMSVYGEPGNSSASAPSVPSIGTRSRPTSPRRTASTSQPAPTVPASAESAGS